jgi:hypothetical protein
MEDRYANPWRTLAARVVYDNPWIRVRVAEALQMVFRGEITDALSGIGILRYALIRRAGHNPDEPESNQGRLEKTEQTE